MPLSDTVERVKSGVFHIVYLRDDERIGSGTAFSSYGYLLTNFHVANAPASCQVSIRRDGDAPRDGFRLSGQDFRLRTVSSSPENSFYFAILRIPEVTERPGTYSFILRHSQPARIGDRVAFLGYPFEHENLTCHSGIISSFYQTGPVSVIQLDASVNPSNSGGPLLDPESGEVLGVVTRKATGLTQAFERLRRTIQANIAVLNAPNMGAEMAINGVRIFGALRAGQEQMLITLGEIERQANVGIGYAFSTMHLMDDNVIFDQMHPDRG